MFCCPPNVPVRGRYVVGDDPVAALGRALGDGVLHDTFGLRGEADDEPRPRIAGAGQRRQDVGIGGQLEPRRFAAGLLQLLAGRIGDLPVRDGGGAHGHVGRQGGAARRQHLLGRLDMAHRHARRVRLGRRPGYQHRFGAAARECCRDGMALAARRTIADEADGIDRLMGRAAGDDGAPSAQRAGSQLGLDRREYFRRLGHAAKAELAAGHGPFAGADAADATALEQRQIGLGGGMVPHAHIHGRRDQRRLVAGEQGRRGEIVGDALRHLGQDVGARRCYDHEVGLAAQADVPHLALVRQREEIGVDLVFAECRQR